MAALVGLVRLLIRGTEPLDGPGEIPEFPRVVEAPGGNRLFGFDRNPPATHRSQHLRLMNSGGVIIDNQALSFHIQATDAVNGGEEAEFLEILRS